MASKKAKTAPKEETVVEEGQVKLNRSPTKVLLLTNVASSSQPEETVKANIEEWVKKFGAVKECRVVRVANVPEEDAIRVFAVFDNIKASSKAYASLRGHVMEGRPLRARFYDEKRFQEGELYKVGSKRYRNGTRYGLPARRYRHARCSSRTWFGPRRWMLGSRTPLSGSLP